MNVFTTDHPMMSEPSASTRRTRRWLLAGLMIYPAYLLLFGPLIALEGRGFLGSVPESVLDIIATPAAPIFHIPVVRNLYGEYLDWWYHDPNDPLSAGPVQW